MAATPPQTGVPGAPGIPRRPRARFEDDKPDHALDRHPADCQVMARHRARNAAPVEAGRRHAGDAGMPANQGQIAAARFPDISGTGGCVRRAALDADSMDHGRIDVQLDREAHPPPGALEGVVPAGMDAVREAPVGESPDPRRPRRGKCRNRGRSAGSAGRGGGMHQVAEVAVIGHIVPLAGAEALVKPGGRHPGRFTAEPFEEGVLLLAGMLDHPGIVDQGVMGDRHRKPRERARHDGCRDAGRATREMNGACGGAA
ncbi:MAG: hypothetical protein ACKOWF_17580 [Chloroflexota bacterium]